MSHAVAIDLSLPVALALVSMLFVLLVMTALALSLSKPVLVRLPAASEAWRSEEGWNDKAASHSAYLYVDDVDELAGRWPRVR